MHFSFRAYCLCKWLKIHKIQYDKLQDKRIPTLEAVCSCYHEVFMYRVFFLLSMIIFFKAKLLDGC